MTTLSSIQWPDVIAVGIRTTADGPFAEDVFWQFVLPEACVEIPGTYVDGPAFDELCARLPGLDAAKVARAMTSADERIFRVWHREESRFCPGRDELADRFRKLVGKVGGDPDASPPVFERVYAAWSAEPRRYHGTEHLVDCLRELDAVSAPVPTADHVELALWYHDVVYEPQRSDCEERSALALLADAVTLAIPETTARVAANLVRATAHAQAHELSSLASALVVDIDLSILGRDVLRFMDYEYSVEEEYAWMSRLSFRFGRGRFLAALLARPHIFRTEHFRTRYEQRARRQLQTLLASARYRS
jgi:predicted metal-dependent HD superfamily phosphohydrolase